MRAQREKRLHRLLLGAGAALLTLLAAPGPAAAKGMRLTPQLEAHKYGSRLFPSPGGQLMAIGVAESSVLVVWDTKTATPLVVVEVGDIAALAWSPDENMLATCGGSEVPTVWDIRTGEAVHRLRAGPEKREGCWDIDWHPTGDRLAIGGYRPAEAGRLELNEALDVWHLGDTPSLVHRIVVAPRGTSAWDRVRWSPSGARLAMTEDSTKPGVLWDERGRPLPWSEDAGSWVVPRHRRVVLKDAGIPVPKAFAQLPEGLREEAQRLNARSAVFLDSDRALLSFGLTWSIHSVPSGDLLASPGLGAQAIGQYAWSPRGSQMATAIRSLTGSHVAAEVQVWDLDRARLRETLAFPQTIRSVVWSPDGEHLAIATGTRITVWRSHDLTLRWEFPLPEGEGVAGPFRDGPYPRSERHPERFSRLTWSPDGTQLTVCSFSPERYSKRHRDQTVTPFAVHVWTPAAGRHWSIDSLDGPVQRVAWDRDSSRFVVVVVGQRGPPRMWSRTGQEATRLEMEERTAWTADRELQELEVSFWARRPPPRRTNWENARLDHAGFDQGGGLISLKDVRVVRHDAQTGVSGDELEVGSGGNRDSTAQWLSADGMQAIFKDWGDASALVDLAPDGDVLPLPESYDEVRVTADETRLLGRRTDGTLGLHSLTTGELLAEIRVFAGGQILITHPSGLFDASDLGALDRVFWTRPFDPLRPLALTSFARDYYTPALAERLLDDVLPLSTERTGALHKNIVTPEVALTAHQERNRLLISVEVCGQRTQVPMPDGSRELSSEAHDLRVFLDGRLIGWKDRRLLRRGCRTFKFETEAPEQTGEVVVDAHAFNSDRVKSDSARQVVDLAGSPESRVARAIVVTVGVDDYAGTGLKSLAWAGADAEALAAALGSIPGHEVTTISLRSGGDAPPTRANLEAVLGTLAGTRKAPTFAPQLERSGPSDLVFVSYSGHGVAGGSGDFSLVLQPGESDPRLRQLREGHLVDERELASWLRPILARDIALVIDACQSAASVEGTEFSPGPLGSSGFGQLAYDKGMTILAASQSDSVALESQELRHGLLTWALVEEGLLDGLADREGDGITVAEWFDYAAGRVPDLSGSIDRGEAPAGARAVADTGFGWRALEELDGEVRAAGPPAQAPRVFRFKGAGTTLITAP